MKIPLRCLIVEDSEDDARLVLRNLRDGGFDVTADRVETAAAMCAALDAKPWDIVLSDYNLPAFSGTAALGVLQASGRDLPFIIISGTMGEEAAVEAMRAGAHDYVMKDRLARLVSAVQRELRDVIDRRKAWAAENALRLQSAALAAAANAIVITNRDGIIVWVNGAFSALTGYALAEAVGRNPRELLKSGQMEPAIYKDLWTTIRAGRVWQGEMINRRKDGSFHPEEQTITPVRGDGGEITHFISIKQDLTERKAVDDIVQASRRQFQAVFEQAAVGMVIADGPLIIRSVNRRFCEMTGYTDSELRALSSHDITHPDDVAGDEAQNAQISAGAIAGFSREKRYRRKDGTYFWAKVFVAPLDPSIPGSNVRIGVVDDITERKQAEEALLQQTADLRASNEKLIRFNHATVGRELRMIELKQELNALCARLGEPPRYATRENRAAAPAAPQERPSP